MRKTYMLLVVTIIFSVMFLPVGMMSTQTQQRSQKVVIEVENGEQIDLYEGSYALLIGASDYTKGWKRLPGVKKDLEEIGKSLKKQGFEVEVALNPTSKEFDQAMKSFIRKYGRRANNRLIIYFAGHGETLRTADDRKQGYIVPIDAPTPNKDEAGFKELAINMGLIEIFAKDIEAKHAMFVFDSCFSGTLFRGNEGRPPAMTSKAAKPVRQFITAGDESQTVPDESIFRKMFVRGLEGEADQDEDGYVTGSELGYFLETRVANYSNNSQTPRSGKIRNPDLDQGDFVFALAKPIVVVRPRPKIEIEREVPLGTLIVIANKRDMEILLDKKVIAKSQAIGEKITIKNVEAGRPLELIGRIKGEKDIIEKVEIMAGTKKEVSLGQIVTENSVSETSNAISHNTNNNKPISPVYKPSGILIITVNRRDMEILLDKKIVAKSQIVGEKITINNVEAGRPLELIGRIKGEKDIIEKVKIIAGTRNEVSLGKIVTENSISETSNAISHNISNNKPTLPVYKSSGTPVTPLMKSYSYETVTVDNKGNIKDRVSKQSNYYEEDLGGKSKLEMIEVIGGTFMMGVSNNEVDTVLKNLENDSVIKEDVMSYTKDERPIHEVRIENFYMGKYEVTQGQWKAIMGSNPSGFKGDDDLPVEQVSWNDAVEFCKKLSAKTGREYRLPSEAEWEYAARGGTATTFAYGETINTNIVNYDGNYPYGNATKGENRGKTVKVGSFVPNGYGLYDMHGNVWEWCQDIYQNSYEGAPIDGRAWEKRETSDGKRVLRGGSWVYSAYVCRSAYRYSLVPDERYYILGFRVVVSAEIQSIR